MPFALSYPPRMFVKQGPIPVKAPGLIAVNEPLASFLGIEPTAEMLAGNRVPEGAQPVALAYAGHQFGHFVPQLGDGRAILIGELKGKDLQWKGAGQTPFSRGGDGRAALGPVLREYVVSEAMHALGIPTTRALGAATTGEHVLRDSGPIPGAVLVRVAASHLRVGTFEYFAARQDHATLEALLEYALARHYPQAPKTALGLLESVLQAQVSLVSKWLAVGFVHGVMNTDNFSISGETLDYGPCAFLDAYDPVRKFSSIDRHGRYAFGEQPNIALWNLTRFAETLLPFSTPEALTECLNSFAPRFQNAYAGELRKKLGIEGDDGGLIKALLTHMAETHADYTHTFRRLALDEDAGLPEEWVRAWRERKTADTRAENPAYIPRNHAVEHMIARALAGDFGPFHRLNAVLSRPFEEQPDTDDLSAPPGEEQWGYRTFCGT